MNNPKTAPLVVERIPGQLLIPKGAWIFLGNETNRTDYLSPLEAGTEGWYTLGETWSCYPETQIWRRTPCGLGMMGYSVIPPETRRCIALYDGRPEEKFSEDVRKLFDSDGTGRI